MVIARLLVETCAEKHLYPLKYLHSYLRVFTLTTRLIVYTSNINGSTVGFYPDNYCMGTTSLHTLQYDFIV